MLPILMYLLSPAQAAELPLLRPGSELHGRITGQSSVVHTDTLDESRTAVRGVAYRIQVEKSGRHTVELCSHFFDAYLVLRDERGRVLAEADWGLIATHARFVVSLRSSKTYLLEACALRGSTGPFRVRLYRGRPESLPAGELDGAELEDARARVAALDRALPQEDPRLVRAINALASLLEEQGLYAEAERLVRRALGICEKTLGPEHHASGTELNNLAELLRAQGKYAEAEQRFRRALSIREKALGAEHALTASSLARLAALLRDQGRQAEALPLARRALAIHEKVLGPEHPRTAVSLNNLALLFWDRGELDEVEPLFRRALAISEKALGAGHPRSAMSLNNLAALLRERGAHAEAEELLHRALKAWNRTLGSDHRCTAASLNNLGNLRLAQGKFDEAERLFRRALGVYQTSLGPEHPWTVRSLGRYLRKVGRLDRVMWERALELSEVHLGFARQELLLSSRADGLRVVAGFADTLDLLLSLAPAVGDPREAHAETWRRLALWKGMAFRHTLRVARARARGLGPGQRAMLARLRELSSRLSALAYQRRIPDLESHRASFAKLCQERSTLETDLARELGLSAEDRGLDARTMSRFLPARHALVDFFVHRPFRFARVEDGKVVEKGSWQAPRILAWVLRAGSEKAVLIDLGDAARLRRTAESFLDRLAGGRRGRGILQGDRSAHEAMRAGLWDPIAKQLEGVGRVFVCADRFLAQVPFGAIRLPDERWLLELCDFVYIQDSLTLARMLREGPPERSAAPSLLALGGVDHEEVSKVPRTAASEVLASTRLRGSFARDWIRLPQTEREARGILDLHERVFGGSSKRMSLSGPDASEEAVKLAAGDWRVMHLATHGFYERKGVASLWGEALRAARETEGGGDPLPLGPGAIRPRRPPQLEGALPSLLCGLVFAGANKAPAKGRDDGILTGEEVAMLDLSRCELAFLSACESGLGEDRTGEGLMSLRRCFREAGTRTVISTLWLVEDQATRELAHEFYTGLFKEKKSAARALRDARLSLLRRFPERPDRWAAFVLAGEWR